MFYGNSDADFLPAILMEITMDHVPLVISNGIGKGVKKINKKYVNNSIGKLTRHDLLPELLMK